MNVKFNGEGRSTIINCWDLKKQTCILYSLPDPETECEHLWIRKTMNYVLAIQFDSVAF